MIGVKWGLAGFRRLFIRGMWLNLPIPISMQVLFLSFIRCHRIIMLDFIRWQRIKTREGAVIDIKKEGASLIYDASSFFSICVVLRHAARHAQRGGDGG